MTAADGGDLAGRLGRLEERFDALVDRVRWYHPFGAQIRALEDDRRWAGARLLRAAYGDLAAPAPPPASGMRLADWELRVRSQNGEDGVLLELFRRVGVRSRAFVEFGIEDGRQCNSALLATVFGWSGLFLERDPWAADAARAFYSSARPGGLDGLRIVTAEVQPDTIDGLIKDHGPADPDLLSVDIDGNDYWVWRAITGIAPRVVVVEYNASVGPDLSVTTVFDPHFDRAAKHPSGYYHGASLAALTRLAAEKGYALVGCESNGVNAFFVRRDLLGDGVRETTPAEAFRPHAERLFDMPHAEQFGRVAHLEWITV